jgi:molybdopterin molybdotransferase
VAVLSTGNELAEPGTAVTAGQVWESNSFMLAAAARLAGCVARRRPVVRDDANEVLTAVTEAIADADLLVTSGGISMGGEHDSVKAALQDLGTVSFRKVAMRPGMPQGFGVLGPAHTPVFTLPGNPVSAYVSFCLFVLPAVRALQGRAAGDDPRATPAVLTAPVRSAAGKRTFIGAVHEPEAGLVTPLSERSTHNLAVLARANALIIVPDETTALAAGDPVDVMRLPCDPRAGPEPAAGTGAHSSMALTSRASTAST